MRRVFEAVGLRLMTEYSIHVLIVCHRDSHITGLTTGLVPPVAFLSPTVLFNVLSLRIELRKCIGFVSIIAQVITVTFIQGQNSRL